MTGYYYSPSSGNAWTVTDAPTPAIIAGWPEDTMEVPAPVGNVAAHYEGGVFTWIPSPASERIYLVSKFTIWLRLTDDEAEAVTSAFEMQPARLRGLWDSASNVWSDSEFFGTLKAFVTGVVGEARANQILAPE